MVSKECHKGAALNQHKAIAHCYQKRSYIKPILGNKGFHYECVSYPIFGRVGIKVFLYPKRHSEAQSKRMWP